MSKHSKYRCALTNSTASQNQKRSYLQPTRAKEHQQSCALNCSRRIWCSCCRWCSKRCSACCCCRYRCSRRQKTTRSRCRTAAAAAAAVIAVAAGALSADAGGPACVAGAAPDGTVPAAAAAAAASFDGVRGVPNAPAARHSRWERLCNPAHKAILLVQ